MTFKSGEKPGKGKYKCNLCGYIVTIEDDSEALPICPQCQNEEYTKV